jgi:outer membrane protein assembly factor BamD
VVSLTNAMKDYPDSQHREEIMFLIVKSNYLLAENSIKSKKDARYRETIKTYHKFVDAYKESKFIREAENYFDGSLKELEKIND